MDLATFLDTVKRLRCIDLHDFAESGVASPHANWPAFSHNPAAWLVLTDDASAAAVWRLVEAQPSAPEVPAAFED